MRRHALLVPSSVLCLLTAACGGGSDSTNNAPQATGTVRGTVVNAPTAVSGVRIRLSGPGGTFEVRTSSNGTYDLSGVPTGRYTVEVFGRGVFDAAGDPIADKIDLRLPNVLVSEGVASIGGRPLFLPERVPGTPVDTAGTNTATIPAGTVVSSNGATIVFDEETVVTFRDTGATEISITPIPIEDIPVGLPSGLTAAIVYAVEPAGAAFDIPPSVRFPNEVGLPAGTNGVSLIALDFDLGTWAEFGTGRVSADGATVVSEAGEGPAETGFFAVAVDAFCTTAVQGRVESTFGDGIANVQIVTVGGLSGTTNSNGDFTISGVALPSANFPVTVNALPPVNIGFAPNDSNAIIAACGGTTNVGTIVLGNLSLDESAPEVSTSSPLDGAVDVADSTSVSVDFSELMSPGSFDASTVSLTADGAPVAGNIFLTTFISQSIVRFVPTSPLPTGAACVLTVDGSVMDTVGNPMGSDFTVSFTVSANPSGAVPSIDVTPDVPSPIDPGDTLQLSVTATDAVGAPLPASGIFWSSDDATIARVSHTGLVTALRAGTVEITAAFGSIADSVTITVDPPNVNSVVLSTAPSAMVVGSTVDLTAEALDGLGDPLLGATFQWSSSDPLVASVDATGLVRALSAGGPVTITATETFSSEQATTAIVVVDPITITEVSLNAPVTMLGATSSAQFSAMALDSGQMGVPGATFTWSSTNASIASVNAAGLVTGVANGTATIRATANGVTGVFDEAVVTVFEDSPMVVTIVGGLNGTTPLEDVRVIIQDTVDGSVIDDRTTGSNGAANFGLTGNERVTLTIVEQGDVQQGGRRLFTYTDIPVGTYTHPIHSETDHETFEVSASVPGNMLFVEVVSGGPDGSDEASTVGQSSPVTVPLVEIYGVQPNGLTSFIAFANDVSSSDPWPQAAGFLLDQDPSALAQTTTGITLTEANVVDVPFTSMSEVGVGSVTVLRDGLTFHVEQSDGPASTTGLFRAPTVPGADRFQFELYGNPVPGAVETIRLMNFNSIPASITAELPAVNMTDVAYGGMPLALTWMLDGADAANVDVVSISIRSEQPGSQGLAEDEWMIVSDPTVSEREVPALPSDLSELVPDPSAVVLQTEAIGLDGVMGFGGIISGLQAHSGNFGKFVFEDSESAFGGFASVAPVTFSIGGAGSGTLVLQHGNVTVPISSGVPVFVPDGALVTLTANAGGGGVVSVMESSSGTPNGVGTSQATVLFTGGNPVTGNVEFE